MYRTTSVHYERQPVEGKPAGKISRLRLFLLFLVGINLLAALQLLLMERGALKKIIFRGSRSWGQQFDPSIEIWAQGHTTASADAPVLRSMLAKGDLDQLSDLCGRCLYHTLRNAVRVHGLGDRVFVATGDIEDMWVRDSSVQLGIYLPRLTRHPALRRVIEGAIRMQAFYILQDPYANSYSKAWRNVDTVSESDRMLGRGGWVATRNYELDSGAYFINLLWNYFQTPSIFARERFLNDSMICDAVSLLVDTWTVELRHEERSPYRYSELERNGVGPPTGYTGMSWSGFRPSDDAQQFGYNIPVNMYAVGALERALHLNKVVWHKPGFSEKAERLAAAMQQGIETFGIVTVDNVKVYAYEVDGLGSAVVDFDDPNLPSLLAMPLLGYRHYDREIYRTTVKRLLSSENSYFFKGNDIEGLGSPHTGANMVWPLSVMVQAITAPDPQEKVRLMQMILHHMQCNNGLMHESVNVMNSNLCTRPVFEWANAMLVALFETMLGRSCDYPAEELRLQLGSERLGTASAQPLALANVQFRMPNLPQLKIPQVRDSLPVELGGLMQITAKVSALPAPAVQNQNSKQNALFLPQLEADIHHEA
eukprot:jgi/Botrbrau1/93/Bobra.0022s0083.1